MAAGSSAQPLTTPMAPRLQQALVMARGAPPPFMGGRFRRDPSTAQCEGVVLPTALSGPPPKAASLHSPAAIPTARAGASACWYCRDTGIECALAPRTAWWALPSKAAPPIRSEPAPEPAPTTLDEQLVSVMVSTSTNAKRTSSSVPVAESVTLAERLLPMLEDQIAEHGSIPSPPAPVVTLVHATVPPPPPVYTNQDVEEVRALALSLTVVGWPLEDINVYRLAAGVLDCHEPLRRPYGHRTKALADAAWGFIQDAHEEHLAFVARRDAEIATAAESALAMSSAQMRTRAENRGVVARRLTAVLSATDPFDRARESIRQARIYSDDQLPHGCSMHEFARFVVRCGYDADEALAYTFRVFS